MNRNILTDDNFNLFNDLVHRALCTVKRFEIDDTNIFIYYDCDIRHCTDYLNNLLLQLDFKLYCIETDSIILQDKYNAKIRVYFNPYTEYDSHEQFIVLLKELSYCLQGKYEQEKRKES